MRVAGGTRTGQRLMEGEEGIIRKKEETGTQTETGKQDGRKQQRAGGSGWAG